MEWGERGDAGEKRNIFGGEIIIPGPERTCFCLSVHLSPHILLLPSLLCNTIHMANKCTTILPASLSLPLLPDSIHSQSDFFIQVGDSVCSGFLFPSLVLQDENKIAGHRLFLSFGFRALHPCTHLHVSRSSSCYSVNLGPVVAGCQRIPSLPSGNPAESIV